VVDAVGHASVNLINMTEHSQTTISLSVFSARRFYSTSPHTSSQSGLIHHSVQLPSTGIHSSSKGLGSLVWVDGLAVQASRTQAFVGSLRRGEIPKPLTQASALPAHIHVNYLSPTNLALSGHTLISVLGLAAPLLQVLASSNYRGCATCATRLRMYSSAAELTEEILEAFLGKRIDILLRAPMDLLDQWSAVRGFSTQECVGGGHLVELDSLIAKPEHFERLRKVLDLAWTLPDMNVLCRDDRSTTAYAPHGYCAQCNKPAPAISNRKLSTIFLQGIADNDAPELLLEVFGVSVKHLLTSPLSSLAEHLVSNSIASSDLREALRGFGLHGLTLGRTCDTLAASALARVAIVAAALNHSKFDLLTILDIPSGLLSSSEELRAQQLLEHSARSRTIVLLKQHDASHRGIAQFDKTPPSGMRLGTLGLRERHDAATSTIELVRGARHEIVVKDETSADRIAAEISAVMSGRQATLASYEAHTPCEPHLIDICSLTSHSRRILAQEFGLYEPLTKLFASSMEARVRGLTPKDFNLSARSKASHLCPECSGAGVILESVPHFERPEVRPCMVCLGTRFRAPIKDIEFRGRPLWRVLNSTFTEEASVLRALPKVSKTLSLLALLELDKLPLGMPTSLLSFSERRLTAIATSILSASASRPPVLVIEEPFAGLSDRQAQGLTALMSEHELGRDVTWIIVTLTSSPAPVPH
jgi:ABC-type transport system involved in cytochrome c biogenesis ATPase subunit